MHSSHRRVSKFLNVTRSGKSRLALVASLTLVGAMLTASIANASSVTTATFTGGAGTATSGGTLYAKQGATVTLTVITSNDTKCVDVAGAFSGHQTSATAKTSWTFTTTAGAGDGVQAVTASASPSVNTNDKCTGNTGSAQASYTLDNTGPVVTAALSPVPNAAGWNKADVGITWTATDAGAGVSSGPTPGTDSVSSSTAGVVKTSSAIDRLGNTGSGTATVKLDKTAPSISGSRSPAANGAGWNNTNVTVAFTCSDALSGIKTCTGGGSVVVSAEGANQSVAGTAVDNADNSASTSVSGISIDKTAPSLTGTPTTAPNANGWYNGNVIVQWSASDALSGLASAAPADSTITGEGSGLKASASIADVAGNVKNADSSAVNIDRSAPTTGITGASNTWENGGVKVKFQPSDNLSGVASTTYTLDGGAPQTDNNGFTIPTEGDHTVTFFSTDKAGNSETPQTAHVKIDKTAPTISHTFIPSAYTDGAWTNADVTVTFQCADALSGVASCTAPVDKSAEGAGQQVVGTAVDAAGNSATDTATVSIDKTPPTISASADRAANGAGWYDDDVTVSFTCADALSGVETCPAPKTLTEGADQSASGTVNDAAGNSASDSVTGINIDKTAPTLTGSFSSGWHTGDVTVAWSCTDSLSGPVAQPTDDTVTGEGADLSSTRTCTDNAGNSSTKTVSGIMIDRTAPTTTSSVPDPLASGWYADAVEVTLTGHDTLSGVDTTYYKVDDGSAQTYTGPFSFDQKGTHTITFWSTDVAGNVEDDTVNSITLKIDGNPPTTTVISPISPASGWFVTSGIPVAFDAEDAESGVAATYYQIDGGDVQTYGEPFTEELSTGTHTITYWSVDLAGNTEAKQSIDVNVDTVPPTVVGSRTPAANSNGWNNSDVTVHFDATDPVPGSGIATGTVTPDVTITAETTGTVVNGSAQDVAGNTGTDSVTVKLDKTAPSINGAVVSGTLGNNGWYTSEVKVHFTCSDTLSGIEECPADVTLSNNGANQSVTRSTTDKAGNSNSAIVSGISIDSEKPVITSVNVANGTYTLGAVPAPTCTATDSGSGLASCQVVVTGGTNGVGTFTATSTATDQAGNTETRTDTYRVIYRFDGFLQPINDTAHQVGASTSVFKGGSTVPVKVQLKRADGTIVQPTSAPMWLTPVKGSSMNLAIDESVYTASADSGSTYRYDAAAQQFIYNWKSGSGGNYWRIGVKFDDGQTYYVNIGLR